MKNSPEDLDQTLDPEDWTGMRALGHRMVDDMIDYLATVRERPVWRAMPSEARARLAAPLPLEPQGADVTYEDFKTDVLPYPLGGIHPRFWGWVIGTGTAGGMLAEMLAAGMNSNVHGGEHAAAYVEAQVLSWLKQALGYPDTASGVLLSGGSMANFVGLAAARERRAGWDVKREGLNGAHGRLTFYASSETHSSVRKAIELLGVGGEGLRTIETDAEFRIRMDHLRAAVAADRAAGHVPVCVVANAGTVNSGAIDPLDALADFCRDERLWLHIDGAFGAIAAISPRLRPLLKGMERADSLAFDLHKWMYMPYEVGCTLVRLPEDQRAAFQTEASYLAPLDRGVAAGPHWFNHYGLELSRGFRALKVWFSLKEHGLRRYRTLVEQNVWQARYLADRIAADPRLELMAPVPLNVVAFRYVGALTDNAALTEANREILLRLQESGAAVLTSSRLRGQFVLRVAITNHRSRREDFDLLIEEVLRIGESIAAGTAARAG
jgi:glutamate/tyrosine decarboxylase-like PLP-dependent enzyme